MADTFNIDGLLYTDKLPHSRIERILYAILKKQGSGGGGGSDTDVDLVVDSPSDIGTGLTISNNKITVNAISTMDNSDNPITSGAVYDQLDMAGRIMAGI